ncbi:hypothetical protein RHMOL_Rhmol04G0310600 [Rhododendron molle]|uniref:Uncharacterized protein n=1 Tax=Rhododendron molle TaxID=49168 RepID=A0ACC0P6H4_RHOML|nr:hypothetical protein RHMOL_Rhmol04G0310600 [Rhododendron molle]
MNDVQEAQELLNRMSQMQPFPPIIQINKLLGSIAKSSDYATTLSHFRKLHLLGIEVDLYTLSIASNCCCHLNRVDFGISLLCGLFKRSCAPDVTFTTLINGLIIEDRTIEARELFKKLVNNREVEPNVVMYGTIITMLCKTGNTVAAIRLLRIMEERGCKPNTIAYSVIIDSLCKDRMVDDAVSLFIKMKGKGILLDVVAYTSLIHGLCSFGRWKEAMRMLREMLNAGIHPNVHTFNGLVDALYKEGEAKEADEVLEVMIERGVGPDVVTYSMDIVCKAKWMKQGECSIP